MKAAHRIWVRGSSNLVLYSARTPPCGTVLGRSSPQALRDGYPPSGGPRSGPESVSVCSRVRRGDVGHVPDPD